MPSVWLKKLSVVALKKRHDAKPKSKHGVVLQRRLASVQRSKRNFGLRQLNVVGLKRKLDAWQRKRRNVEQERKRTASPPNMHAAWLRPKHNVALKRMSKEKFKTPRGIRQSTNASWPRKQLRKLRSRNMFLKLSVVQSRSYLNRLRNLRITLTLDTTTELSSNLSASPMKVSQVKRFHRLRLTLSRARNLRNEPQR